MVHADITQYGLRENTYSDAGATFIVEIVKAAKCLGMLSYSLALEAGTDAAASTLPCRQLWIIVLGVYKNVETWRANPIKSGQELFGAAKEMVASYKVCQAKRVIRMAVAPMLNPNMPSSPPLDCGQAQRQAQVDALRKVHTQKSGKEKGCSSRSQHCSSQSMFFYHRHECIMMLMFIP